MRSVTFSPDGARLATAGQDGVRVWDASAERVVHSLAVPGGATAVAFSADGARLAGAGRDNTVRVWDAATARQLAELNHPGGVNGVTFSPDGRLATAGLDRTVRVWAATGQELLVLRGHASGEKLFGVGVLGVAFSPDGACLATAGEDRTVRVWDVTGRKTPLLNYLGGVNDVAYSPDGTRLATAGRDNTVRVWDTATDNELAVLRGRTGEVVRVAYSPDGARLASGHLNGTVRVWDAATDQVLHTLNGHTNRVGGVAFSPGGTRLATCGGDETICVWDTATGKMVRALKGHAESVNGLVFSPDGRLASAGRDGIRVWDTAAGRELLSLTVGAPGGRGKPDTGTQSFAFGGGSPEMPRIGPDWLNGVAFTPDGARLATAGRDGTVRVWDTATGRVLLTLKGHTGSADSVAFSPDGSRLASTGRDQIERIWDAATGRELLALKTEGWGRSVAFHPDGARLASAGISYVRVWDARPLTDTLRNEREARSRVGFLLDRPLVKDEARDFLRTDATISDPVRQLAQTVLDRHTDDPQRLMSASWDVVRRPGSDAAKYRRGVQLAEGACRLKPDDGNCLTTLGVAYYRVGQYPQALDTLTRSRPLNAQRPSGGDRPTDIAFLAMSQEQLGQPEPARKLLAELRELCRKEAWASNAQAQAFLREAEALIQPEPPRRD